MIPVQYNPPATRKIKSSHNACCPLYEGFFYFPNITIAIIGRFIYSQNVLTTFCFFSMKAIRECFLHSLFFYSECRCRHFVFKRVQ